MATLRLFTCMVSALLISTGRAQEFFTWHTLPEAAVFLQDEHQNDPAYATYREGYSLILKDRWSEAMKKFEEIRSKYPRSAYADDAAYWSAYAQKRLDRKKGIAAYEKFLEEFPNSRYIDDALADMRDDIVIIAPEGQHPQVKVAPQTVTHSYGAIMRESERAMRQAERAMRQAQHKVRGIDIRLRRLAPNAPPTRGMESELDPQTRVKLEALYALAESNNDKEAFSALKEVAADKSQPHLLRITAIESLPGFQKFDVLGTLVEIARTDTSEEVQLAAIYAIADLNVEKNKSADALIALFRSQPQNKEKQLATTLYAIAEIGNEKAIDFLATIAASHENLDLRSDAVYYLGTIGNEKSRAALLKILKGK